MRHLINDASIFEIQALEVNTPNSPTELVQVVKRCLTNRQPITMRAGGTSLAGQAIGSGVVIDISQHLTHILEYRPEEKEVVVEPGVIQDDLNDFVKPHGLRFAPDTSTSSRAMIGGMIGNNACGSYSVYYGTTREHVKSVDVILADGTETTFGPLSAGLLKSKLAQQDFEGNIYRTVFNLLERHGKTLLDHYPHPSIKRRNTGYALDELYRHHQPFNPKGKPFNLAPLICGSEGTLAVIKQACLQLVDLPKHRQLMCAHFDSIEAAMKVVPRLLEFNPAAIELIDKATLDGAKQNRQQQANRFWIQGDPQAVLVIELFDESQTELQNRLQTQQAWLLANGAYYVAVIDSADSDKVWAVRKAGLGLLMGKVSRKKAVAVIEDAAVPVINLFDFFQDVQALMAELQVNCVYYGHASVGLIHIRPELDLASKTDRVLFETIAKRHAQLVKKYRGAISGEHGDGRLRAPFIKEQVGEQVYSYLLELKHAFDAHGLLNPGVILSDKSNTQHLRANRQPQQILDTGFDWSRDLSLVDAVEKCNGAGVCRQSVGRGVMCPSYQATRNENDSTRGRSNLLRFALTEPNPQKALNDSALKQALDMCLGCKACKTECPANVDMARLKSEVLYQTQGKHFTLKTFFNPSVWVFKNYGKVLANAHKWPATANWLQSRTSVKALLGIDQRRSLPNLVAESQQAWWADYQKRCLSSNPKQATIKVWVLVDLFSQYQEPDVGKAVLQSLSLLGLQVEAVFLKDSPRVLISKGFLKEAQQALLSILKQLEGWQTGDYIVGIEPSELLTWRDEAKDLLKNSGLKSQQACLFESLTEQACLNLVMSYEELLLDLFAKNALTKLTSLNVPNQTVWLHVHCHQKALAKPMDTQKALELINGVTVKMISSGCCGMAGEFGYKHYEVSKKIANQILLPSLEHAKNGDWIVATGTSCRQQLSDLGGYASLHIAQVFNRVLALSK